jgi:glycosyltransferase involved in cell wall biosynthesis
MIVHAYYPLGETRVEREALALLEIGYEVDVICLQDKDEDPFEIVAGINVYRLPVQRRKGSFFSQFLEYLNFFLRVFFILIPLHSKKKYHIVQVHNLPDFLVFSALYPKLSGAKIFLDIHDIMPEFFASKTHKSMDSFWVHVITLQEQLSCRFADHVITVTEIWRERLISRGVDPEKVSVVMNVADDRYFYPRVSWTESNTSNGHFHLIYHGTFKENYGMAELIRSIGLVRDTIPNIQLTIQGGGEYHDAMVSLVEELGLQNQVTINNFAIPVSDLPELINRADMGVVPNRNDLFNGDLLPTKMLEYVSLGKPVVASQTRVISHYFDNSMVQFFEPGNAESLAKNILDSYRNWEKAKEKAKNYLKFTSQYNWKQVSMRYVDLVREHGESFVG